ncbi:MAG: tellurite resistance TerB family protein [Methylococcales bacterium]|nr:tellurite resistance TerB family protein [Methylococcales bacterium]
MKDKPTFKRVVYASFLIARADGDFDVDEKQALGDLIAKDFPQFKLTDILEVLSEATKKIEFDETFGVMELLEEIGKAEGENAALIVRTACYIGAADGDFDQDERKVATQICEQMGLSAATYGL